MCSTTFASLGRAQATALGFSDLPLAVIPHPFGSRSRAEIRELAGDCVADLAKLLCEPVEARRGGDAVGSVAPPRAVLISVADDPDAINHLVRERNWGDGLPVVPPTEARVARMLNHSARGRHDVVAAIAPGFGVATVEGIAINAVLAGCDPAYLPVLIAATEAMAEPQFNLQVIQTTTHPVAVMLMLNGPVVQRLQVNCGTNCFGPGSWANATLGRALRLIQQNIGGALPGKIDQATQGQPGKYTFCFAENETANPWQPLQVERGYAPDTSTVTVVGASGTSNMITHARDAHDLLRVIAGTMRVPATLEYIYGGEPWIVLAPEHAAVLKNDGLEKSDVKHRLWELSKLPASSLALKDLARAQNGRSAELGDIGSATDLPISVCADDITIVVAGGPGTHSVYVPVFGTSRSVTRAIAL